MKKTFITTFALLTATVPAFAQTISKQAQKFLEHDPFGIAMAIIAMSVVFIALVILYFCFKGSAKLLNKGLRKPTIRTKQVTTDKAPIVTEAQTGHTAPEEIVAAISMALFLHEDGMHDAESDVLTLSHSENTAWTGRGNNLKAEPLRKF